MTGRTTTAHRYPELDALRGFAAVGVVIFHLSMPHINPGTFSRYFLTGVDLFFIISGFVIPFSINHVRSGQEFVRNRFVRLYPVYWVCLSLSVLLRLVSGQLLQPNDTISHFLGQYAVNLTMLQYYFKVPDMEDPYWSLSIELMFYVVIFQIFKWKKLAKAEPILLSLVLLKAVLLALMQYVRSDIAITCILKVEYYFPLINFLPLFLMGLVFYKMRSEGATLFRYLTLLCCFAVQNATYSQQTILSIFAVSRVEYAIIIAVYMLTFQLFVLGKLSFIVNGFTLFLGRISYTLYLFHQFISLNILLPFFMDRWHLRYLLSCSLCFITCIVVASIITIFVDEPIRGALKRRWKPTK